MSQVGLYLRVTNSMPSSQPTLRCPSPHQSCADHTVDASPHFLPEPKSPLCPLDSLSSFIKFLNLCGPWIP